MSDTPNKSPSKRKLNAKLDDALLFDSPKKKQSLVLKISSMRDIDKNDEPSEFHSIQHNTKQLPISKWERINQMSDQLLADAPSSARLIQELANAGLYVDADTRLPRVAVIGEQSHGKSSLFEALTGLDWPRGQSKTTAFPTSLTKLKGASESLAACIIPQSSVSSSMQHAIRRFAEHWSNSSIDRLGELVCSAASIIFGEDHTKQFANWELSITHTSPLNSAVSLTLVDTPGLVSTGFTSTEIETVREIVANIVKSDRTLVLHVIQGSIDLETSASKALLSAENVNPKRVCLVVSKFDLDPNDWVIHRLAQQLKAPDTAVSMTFLFRGRTSSELREQKTEAFVEDARAALLAQKRWAPYTQFANDENILKFCLRWSLGRCAGMLNEMYERHLDNLQDLRIELAALPEPASVHLLNDRKSNLRQSCQKVIEQVRSAIRLNDDEVEKQFTRNHGEPQKAALECVRQLRTQYKMALGEGLRGYPNLGLCMDLFERTVTTEFDSYIQEINCEMRKFGVRLVDEHKLVQFLQLQLRGVEQTFGKALDIVMNEQILGNPERVKQLIGDTSVLDPIERERSRLNDQLKSRHACDAIFRAYFEQNNLT